MFSYVGLFFAYLCVNVISDVMFSTDIYTKHARWILYWLTQIHYENKFAWDWILNFRYS
jgi:hypothetical protein